MRSRADGMDRVLERARSLYDQYRIGHYSYGRKRERYDSLLLESLATLPRDRTIHDIGCGAGFHLELCARLGFPKEHLLGVDLSPTNVREIQSKGFRAICGDGLRLGLESRRSDFTISQGVIHHTDDPFQAFCELARITKRGGLICLNVYNRWHPYYYMVHRAMLPVRLLYWKGVTAPTEVLYRSFKPLLQVAAYAAMGEALDERSARTIFMDQVITPRAHLFSKRKIRGYARRTDCVVERFRYNRLHLMIGALIRVT